MGKDLTKFLVQLAARAFLKSETVAQICSYLLMLHPVRSWKPPLSYNLFGQPAPLLHCPVGNFLFIVPNLNVSFPSIHPFSLILSSHRAVKSLGLSPYQPLLRHCEAVVLPYRHLLQAEWSLVPQTLLTRHVLQPNTDSVIPPNNQCPLSVNTQLFVSLL